MFRVPVREGVELRLLEERHAKELFDVVHRNRPYLREWLVWVDTTTGPDSILDFIRKSLLQFANNNGFAAGIWSAGDLVGTVGFHAINWTNRKVELGYWIDREQQGKGLMNAACRVMIDHAFEAWKLHRVEIHCASINRASNRVAQRLGFRLDGTLRDAQLLYGTYHDMNIYGMLAAEWKERK